jgi:hypothetical protein
MKSSEKINEIAAALSKLQAENRGAENEAVNPFFKSKYSTLKDIWDSVRVSIGTNGLAILQDVITKDNCVSITTVVTHSSGQWIEFGPLEVPFAKKDAHSIGSATSYGKRYALSAAIGVVSGVDDDDGNKAMEQGPLKTEAQEVEQYKFISVEQMEWISDQIGTDKVYEKNMLDHFKVKQLAELPAQAFPLIKRSLDKRAIAK